MYGNFLGRNEREREDANIGATASSIFAFGKNRLVTNLQKHHLLLPYSPNFRCYFSISLLLSNSTNKQILDNHSVTLWELHLSVKSIIVLFISDCPSKAGCDSGHSITPLLSTCTGHGTGCSSCSSHLQHTQPCLPFPSQSLGSPREGGRLGSCMPSSEMLHCANVGQRGQDVGSALYQEWRQSFSRAGGWGRALENNFLQQVSEKGAWMSENRRVKLKMYSWSTPHRLETQGRFSGREKHYKSEAKWESRIWNSSHTCSHFCTWRRFIYEVNPFF